MKAEGQAVNAGVRAVLSCVGGWWGTGGGGSSRQAVVARIKAVEEEERDVLEAPAEEQSVTLSLFSRTWGIKTES